MVVETRMFDLDMANIPREKRLRPEEIEENVWHNELSSFEK